MPEIPGSPETGSTPYRSLSIDNRHPADLDPSGLFFLKMAAGRLKITQEGLSRSGHEPLLLNNSRINWSAGGWKPARTLHGGPIPPQENRPVGLSPRQNRQTLRASEEGAALDTENPFAPGLKSMSKNKDKRVISFLPGLRHP
jgi:hypothetical protein